MPMSVSQLPAYASFWKGPGLSILTQCLYLPWRGLFYMRLLCSVEDRTMRNVCFLTSHSSIAEQLQSDILEATALFGKAINALCMHI
ncbi:hypothetical protein MTR_7g012900 [Medicago truncatula]|uniref:Uncharacterized protein n=1 Tax=Medicago truncatula TaxID=3880 RepID=G7L566_MEDTR|nr:hypothetical protein MTR_7g012900 [Medicago truncatula]